MPLRVRVFSGFVVVTTAAAGLGFYAAREAHRYAASDAAVIDRALDAAAAARSADSGFGAMDAALLRRRSAATPGARGAEEERIAALAARVAEDLRAVADRAPSDAVRAAAAGADAATTAWAEAARAAFRQPSPDWTRLVPFAAAARERCEALVELVARDARRQGEEARAAAAAAAQRLLAGTTAVLLFGFVAALWMARRIAGPVAAAANVASAIAAGRLDTTVPRRGGAEVGALFGAIGRMRDALVARGNAAAAEAQSHLAEAMEVTMDGVVLTDAAGWITKVNKRAAELLPDLALAPGENWNRAAAGLDVPDPAMAAALWHAPPAAAEVRLPGGRWLRISRSPAKGGGAVAILSDISARKGHEAALSESNRRFSAALGNMAQGLCMVDADGRILVCNQRFCEMFGLPPAEFMAGVAMRDASRIAMEAARFPADLLAQVGDDQQSLKGGSKPFSVVREGADGAALATAYGPMVGGGWVATYADVSEQRAAEEKQALLMRELNHRAKNALAVVQAALRLTPKDDAESYAAAVGGRVNALARAHTLLAEGQWSGAELRDLAWGELKPFLGQAAAADKRPQPRAALDGPEVTLGPGAAQAVSMALHELATNATKHGALSAPEGRVSVFWEVDELAGLLRLIWTEAGGPPLAGTPPARRGFGSRLLDATLKDQLGGKLVRNWQRGGLACTVELPLARALAGKAQQGPITTGLEKDFASTAGAGRTAAKPAAATAARPAPPPARPPGAATGAAALVEAASPAARPARPAVARPAGKPAGL